MVDIAMKMPRHLANQGMEGNEISLLTFETNHMLNINGTIIQSKFDTIPETFIFEGRPPFFDLDIENDARLI